MSMSARQQKVLANSMAWLSTSFAPTPADVAGFFRWIDEGRRSSSPRIVELYLGWCSHYGDEFAWIDSFEQGHSNPPISPPAAWLYDAYWTKDYSGWGGWLGILTDCLRDWPRSKPVFARAYTLHCYQRGLLTARELRKCLAEQRS